MSNPIISKITLPDGVLYDIKDTVYTLASTSAAGLMSTADKTKLDAMRPMVVLSYGNSTWNDFIDAYDAHAIVYCRASSNSNPATGSQTRMAFMAYVNNGDSPTEVEFQYYRSVSSHSISQQGDQVFIYKLTSANKWTVTTREAMCEIVPGSGLDTAYTTNTITISHENSVTAQTTQGLYPITIDSLGHIDSYGTAITNVSAFTNDAGYITSADVPLGSSAYTGTISAVGTVASGGTSDSFARGDHVHNITSTTIVSALGYTPASTADIPAGGPLNIVDGSATGSIRQIGASTSLGSNAAAFGSASTASGEYSQVEGYQTLASTIGAHAEGYGSTASGMYTHALGYTVQASGKYAHALGQNTRATSTDDHAEGYGSTASGSYSHALGYQTKASGNASHAEGYQTIANNRYAHALGGASTASSSYTHAEGYNTKASSPYAHAEGYYTQSTGYGSHTEGWYTYAGSTATHAEGNQTFANGAGSHALGVANVANGARSHVLGYMNIASGDEQHVEGKYNIEDTNNIYAHIVGNGSLNANTGVTTRSNAYTLDWNGNGVFAGKVTLGSNAVNNMDAVTLGQVLSKIPTVVNRTFTWSNYQGSESLTDEKGNVLSASDLSDIVLSALFGSVAIIDFAPTEGLMSDVWVYYSNYVDYSNGIIVFTHKSEDGKTYIGLLHEENNLLWFDDVVDILGNVHYDLTKLNAPMMSLSTAGRVTISDNNITDSSSADPATDTAGEIVTFTSGDVADQSAVGPWSLVSPVQSGDTHNTLLNKISNMFKNLRYLHNRTNVVLLTDIVVSLGTVSSTKTIYKQNGIVYINGGFGENTSGVFSSATGLDVIGTMPQGYRPLVAQYFTISARDNGGWASANYYPGILSIGQAGQISIAFKAANIQSCRYVHLDACYPCVDSGTVTMPDEIELADPN